MNPRARKERIYRQLQNLVDKGIIMNDIVVQGQMPGLRWTFSPCGYSPRSMSTNDVEWFILGTEATLNKTARVNALRR